MAFDINFDMLKNFGKITGVISIVLTILRLKIIFNFISLPVRKLKNLCFRPSLKIEFKPKNIKFRIPNSDVEHHIHYLHLIITNESKKNYIIPFDSVKIGNNPVFNMNAGSTYNNILGSQWVNCDSEMLTLCKNSWMEITQGRNNIVAKPHIPILFPLSDNLDSLRVPTNEKSLLFLKNKISVSLKINGKSWEYGLEKNRCYEFCINHLWGRISQFGLCKQNRCTRIAQNNQG